jgi:glucose/arabinose dehydrogenase
MDSVSPIRIIGLAVCATLIGLLAIRPALAVEANQQPGSRIELRPADLPAPYADRSASNSPLQIEKPLRAGLKVPQGFEATLFATGLSSPRYLAVSPKGDVYVSESRANRVTVLRDADGNGRADRRAVVAEHLSRPHGLAFGPPDPAAVKDTLYIADLDRIWKLPMIDGFPRQGKPEPVSERGALGDAGGHWTRNIAIAPNSGDFMVAIGSRSNIAEEPVPRATIQQIAADGGDQSTFAAGLRNPVGIAFYPGTDRLFTVVNERDGMGDGLVPDYLTEVTKGSFYGWPYAYTGTNPQPGFADKRPDLVAASLVPDVLFEAHSAPLGLAFYTGEAFPERYRGGAFVTLHGSWNRSDPTGYKVVFVPFEDGEPLGWYETFASGWWQEGEDRAKVWGRPCGIAVMPGGSLLVSDDTGGDIWRIRYTGR